MQSAHAHDVGVLLLRHSQVRPQLRLRGLLLLDQQLPALSRACRARRQTLRGLAFARANSRIRTRRACAKARVYFAPTRTHARTRTHSRTHARTYLHTQLHAHTPALTLSHRAATLF
eukprot:6210495-Pleurochrysis_carterae.AAC.2